MSVHFLNYTFLPKTAKPVQPPPILRPRDTGDFSMKAPELKNSKKSAADTYVPPGYWMRLDDEIVWCTDELAADRFGSLDRRKPSLLHNSPSIDPQSRYHTVALGGKNSVASQYTRPHPAQV